MASSTRDPGDDSIFAQYVRHADILRNWFVAYGIGGILLFLTKDTAFKSLPKDALLGIAEWFLLGVGAQVLLAFVNKIYNFHLYQGSLAHQDAAQREKSRFKVFRDFYLIDVLLDIVTLGSFAWATFLLFNALRSAPV